MNKISYFIRTNKHYFHILAQSFLPMALSFSIGFFLLSVVLTWNSETKEYYELYSINKIRLHTSFLFILIFSSSWFSCVLSESICGHHNFFVKKGLILGFFFFLITEFMLFFSFFWAYFYLCLNPSFLVGNVWPPKKTTELNVWKLPFINTILLLTSGYAATIAHSILLNQTYNFSIRARRTFTIFLTGAIFFGVAFVVSQVCEYKYAISNIWSNNSFWSCFFLLTGFHGIHVFIGILLLILNLVRIVIANIYEKRHYAPLTFFSWLYKILILRRDFNTWMQEKEIDNVYNYTFNKNNRNCGFLHIMHYYYYDRTKKLVRFHRAIWDWWMVTIPWFVWLKLGKLFGIGAKWLLETKVIYHVYGWAIYHWGGHFVLRVGHDPADYRREKYYNIEPPFWEARPFFEHKQNKIILLINETFSFNSDQHLSYETALFYWHFVDIVWIFLFVFVYIWGF